MFRALQPWFKHRVRVRFEDLAVRGGAEVLDLRHRGVAPFWRGWWMIILVLDDMPERRLVEVEARGDLDRGQRLSLKIPVMGRLNKRLFCPDWRLREIVLQPPPEGESYTVQSLSVVPVLQQFALRHMYSLLAQGSRDLRGRPLKDLAFLVARTHL